LFTASLLEEAYLICSESDMGYEMTFTVVVVSGSNFVLPKLPVIYSALLMSAAQIITSLAIDYYFYNLFSYPLLIGTLIILLSMVLNVVVDLKEREKLV
jgi:transporter family-2 protein